MQLHQLTNYKLSSHHYSTSTLSIAITRAMLVINNKVLVLSTPECQFLTFKQTASITSKSQKFHTITSTCYYPRAVYSPTISGQKRFCKVKRCTRRSDSSTNVFKCNNFLIKLPSDQTYAISKRYTNYKYCRLIISMH